MVNAVVLAGNPHDESKLVYGKNKALLEIANKPLVGYVIDALENSDVNKIALVSSQKSLEGRIRSSKLEFVEESINESRIRSFVDNLIAGYRKAQNPEGVLYVTCDTPLLTPKIINYEIGRFRAVDADLILMLTDEAIIPRQFLELKRNGPLKIDRKGKRWSNMFYVNNLDVDALLLDIIENVGETFSLRRLDSVDSRKKIFSLMFRRFRKVALKYAIGRLKKEDVKEAFYEKFHKKLEILDASSYHSCADVDYNNDFDFLKGYIEGKNKPF